MLALAGAAAIGYGIYKAAQLQTQVTRLYTRAGESQKNLPMMTRGILKLSGSTGENQFLNCNIGVDTIARTVANANIEFTGGSPRNVFTGCTMSMFATNAGVLGVITAGAAAIGSGTGAGAGSGGAGAAGAGGGVGSDPSSNMGSIGLLQLNDCGHVGFAHENEPLAVEKDFLPGLP